MKKIDFTKRDGKIYSNGCVIESLFGKIDGIFKTLANGEYELIVRRKVKKRSIEQNSLLWLYYACIENETGQDKNDIHSYYCGKFLTKEVEIYGKIERIVGGTRNLTTVEFKYFLDRVQADVSSELGIELPDPNDLRWDEFKSYYQQYL